MLSMHFHLLSMIFIFTIAPLSGLATPFASLWDDVHSKHTWDSVPENWVNLGHPPTDTTINLHIALKPQHENALIDTLYEVSSPGHPKYGAHLSKEQVAELVAPPPDVLELVKAWLEHHGVLPITVSTKHGDSWLTLNGVPVSRANKLLSASYQFYQHIGTNETVLRTLSYGLPAALLTRVQTVAPTTHFGFPRTPWQEPLTHPGEAAAARARAKEPAGKLGTVLSSRDEYVTPSLLRRLYKTFSYVPAAVDQNVLGVLGFIKSYPSRDDLTLFMKEFRTDGASATFDVVRVGSGGYDPNKPGVEANINIQYTEAMAYPTPHIFYSTEGVTGLSQDDPFITWLDYVLGQPKVPQTMSSSFGGDEYQVPVDYAAHLCNLFAQLGARGSSVLFASGNYGVGRGDCLFYGGSRVLFTPTFPSTCPWVTSVGGTTSFEPEVAASFSGGGFSRLFSRPRYQDNAAPNFLRTFGRRYRGLYEPAGRGIPDIALQATAFRIIVNRLPYAVQGTSCATPSAAGIISLLNDYLLSTNRPPLGFLNPWLYGRGLGGLNDITFGSNPGCNTDGFPTIVGWDPVTGLGTLDFERLLEIIGVPTPDATNVDLLTVAH